MDSLRTAVKSPAPDSTSTNVHGTAPSYQSKIGQTVAREIRCLATVECDLVGAYANDYALALNPIQFDRAGAITNPEVREVIKFALMSSDCPPIIKAEIFRGDKRNTRTYRHTLRKINQEIQAMGYRVNLDQVVIDRFHFSDWNLSRMTARDAQFSYLSFQNSDLSGADLTGAKFERVIFNGAIMHNVIAPKVHYTHIIFIKTDVFGMITDDASLLELCSRSVRTNLDGRQETADVIESRFGSDSARTVTQEFILPNLILNS